MCLIAAGTDGSDDHVDHPVLEEVLGALEAVGVAAREAGTALAMFVDELQYVEEEQLAALITALHRVAQRQLPIVLVGAGLPQLRGLPVLHLPIADMPAARMRESPGPGRVSTIEAIARALRFLEGPEGDAAAAQLERLFAVAVERAAATGRNVLAPPEPP